MRCWGPERSYISGLVDCLVLRGMCLRPAFSLELTFFALALCNTTI